jgi:lipopolysaccharide transport system permease protein
MREELTELWRFRYLLRQFVLRELKIRYKNSVLGFLWSIVPPLLQVLVLTFFMRSVVMTSAKNYSAYLLCGMIPWTFFSTALLDSSQSLLLNYGIMRKVYMPREIIPLAKVISNFIHFLLGWMVYFCVFYVGAPLVGIHPPDIPHPLWFPVVIVVELILVTGLSLWVAALNLFYQDLQFILQTLFSLMLFLMPILYPIDFSYFSLQKHGLAWLFPLYMLNPIAAIISGFRHGLLLPPAPEDFSDKFKGIHPIEIDTRLYIGALLVTLVIAWAGYAYFNRRKWQFVERY